MKAFILAGGYATRLWPLTEHKAKPLLLLGGKTVVAHLLERIPAGTDVYLLTNAKFAPAFREELKKLGREDVSLFCEDTFSDEGKLGALKSLSVALNYFKVESDIWVLAGDNLLKNLNLEELKAQEDEAALAVQEVPTLEDARAFGVVEENRGRVTSFEEKPAAPKSRLVSTGFFFVGKNLLPVLHETAQKQPDALGVMMPAFLSHNATLKAIRFEGECFDIGSFESYLAAHKDFQTDDCLKDSTVESSGNTFGGKVFLGEGCRVQNCVLHDCIVYPGTTLEHCRISGSIIDKHCHLRGVDINRKLIREGTVLHAG